MRLRGKVAQAEWRLLVSAYGPTCQCCGKTKTRLTKDHIRPRCKEGTSEISNIQILCADCNSRKGATIADYRPDKGRLAELIEELDLASVPSDDYLRNYVEYLSGKLRAATTHQEKMAILRHQIDL